MRNRKTCSVWTAIQFAVALQFVGLSNAFAQTVAESLSKDQIAAIDSAVEKQFEQQALVGVAVGIIKDGEVVFTKGYGFEDQENSITVSDESMFRWASVSKPVTAVAAMLLVDEGKLDLDKDVCDYVPEFPDKGVKITCRDLLCHQSGIVHYTNGRVIASQNDYESPYPYKNVVVALDKFKDSPLVNQPGEKYSYSTHAYILLSAVVQNVAKKPFAEFVKERIFEPSGMKSMQPDYQWIEIAHRAVGYRQLGKRIFKSTNSDVSWKLGGGGFISNVGDMARFAAVLSRKELLSEAAYDKMWTRQRTNDGTETPLGLGFFVDTENGEPMISHNGSQEKARTRMVFFPESESGVVVMTNSEYADPGRISTAILQVLKK